MLFSGGGFYGCGFTAERERCICRSCLYCCKSGSGLYPHIAVETLMKAGRNETVQFVYGE